MANFDMRGQRVKNQYIAGRDINFGAVESSLDLVTELEKLKSQIAQAQANNILPEETGTDAEY